MPEKTIAQRWDEYILGRMRVISEVGSRRGELNPAAINEILSSLRVHIVKLHADNARLKEQARLHGVGE